MTSTALTFRTAVEHEAPAVTDLVRIAYRGAESRAGWTTEADLLDDERIDVPRVAQKITEPDGAVLLAHGADGTLVACCEVIRRDAGLAYFGMFAVRPHLQAAGVGRRVLAEAEQYAHARWGVTRLEMTVIDQRTELIDWYLRRGYARTGETRPFPYGELVNGAALRDDLYFAVLSKRLP